VDIYGRLQLILLALSFSILFHAIGFLLIEPASCAIFRFVRGILFLHTERSELCMADFSEYEAIKKAYRLHGVWNDGLEASRRGSSRSPSMSRNLSNCVTLG
jgi:hypothetical protein